MLNRSISHADLTSERKSISGIGPHVSAQRDLFDIAGGSLLKGEYD
ncbi:hypothetical protein [Cytobacillus firmus]|nr:hypothetical protein [Cytobacillus firmus]MBX9974264.1 hypothetical protein [Cytobacillus firmus]